MSIWIEIHCDVRRNHCRSDNGHMPGDLSRNTRGAVLFTLTRLGKMALEGGWIKDKRGWVCPNCKTVSATSAKESARL